MKLSEYAKLHSVTYTTAWKWFKDGKIPNAKQMPTGTVVIYDESLHSVDEYTVVYCRTSLSESDFSLNAKIDKLVKFCEDNELAINKIVKEYKIPINEVKPKLLEILAENRVTRIVIECKNELALFDFKYIETIRPECKVIVVDELKNYKYE